MNWNLNLEDKSEIYVKRLLEVYNNASETSVDYPEVYPFATNLRNPLSGQLQLVARLLDGGGAGMGVKTKGISGENRWLRYTCRPGTGRRPYSR